MGFVTSYTHTCCNPILTSPTRLTLPKNVDRLLSWKRAVCVCATTSRFAKITNTMALPPNESWTLSSYLDSDEEVDYVSDKNVHEDEVKSSHSLVPYEGPLSAPNPFIKRGDITAPGEHHQYNRFMWKHHHQPAR